MKIFDRIKKSAQNVSDGAQDGSVIWLCEKIGQFFRFLTSIINQSLALLFSEDDTE